MMVRAHRILGSVADPAFAGRRVVTVSVAWDEATRRRLRRTAADGTDVTIALTEDDYLADGAVLDDDGERVVAVTRSPEPAVVVRLNLGLPPRRLVEQALMLGHAFGNQHVPMESEGDQVRIPLTTSESVARATVDALGLRGATVSIEEVALARFSPLGAVHSHRHGDAG
jgi:urease accessory protein